MRLVRTLASIFALALACAPSLAANLIVNGGFEAGTFAGWGTTPAGAGSFFGVYSGTAHTGTYAAGFGATAEQFDQIHQSVPTAAGSEFTVSFWVFNSVAGNDGIFVQWNSGTLIYQLPVQGPLGVWTQVSFKVLANSATSELRFGFWDTPSGVFLDDVSVTPDNLVANPSFETGDFTGWNTQAASGGSIFGVGTNSRTGTYGVSFLAVTTEPDQIWQNIPTVAGHTYEVQFWLHNADYSQDSLRVYWEGQEIYNSSPVPFTNPVYGLRSFRVVSSGASSQLRFAAYDIPGGFEIDDVLVREVPGGPCDLQGDANGSGTVDFADITSVLTFWGFSCTP